VVAIEVVRDSLKYKDPLRIFPNFLKRYGQPTEILLSTERKAKGGIPGFRISLFYADLGILATYTTYGYYNGNKIGACFNPKSKNLSTPDYYLDLIEPKSANTLIDAAKMAMPLSRGQIEDIFKNDLPVEKATGMDVHTFYEKYYTDKGEACIVTPADLWP
jgi:hypothetical protein